MSFVSSLFLFHDFNHALVVILHSSTKLCSLVAHVLQHRGDINHYGHMVTFFFMTSKCMWGENVFSYWGKSQWIMLTGGFDPGCIWVKAGCTPEWVAISFGVWYLAQGYVSSALKVSWPLPNYQNTSQVLFALGLEPKIYQLWLFYGHKVKVKVTFKYYGLLVEKKGFISWGLENLKKHANMFQAFIGAVTKWPPNCFL